MGKLVALIFVNESNILTESKASGGKWLWDAFYSGDEAARERGGGWNWGEPKANDPANVEALQFMVDLLDEGVSSKPELGGGTTLQGFFTSGKIGMTPAGGFWAGGLSNAGMAPDEFDVQFFPRWKSQQHQFGATGYVLMESSGNKDLGWEYIKYLTSKEAARLALEGNLATPARRSMMTEDRYADTGPVHWQVFYDTLDKFPNTAPIPSPPEANEMTNVFTKNTGLAVTGEMPPKKALDKMQRELEGVFSGG